MATSLSALDRPLFHAGLLVATLASCFVTFWFQGGWQLDAMGPAALFSFALLMILGAHEMGHYLLARYHGVDSSLPYFIPLPMLGIGTLGAVIRLRGKIPSRNALVDIGAAGPLAGFVVAIPVLLYGFWHSTVVTVPYSPGLHLPGHISLYGLVHALVKWLATRGNVLGETEILGDNVVMIALTHLRFGTLGPHQDVIAHPFVQAGWFGLFVTTLNLIPIGQLDAGHLTAALWGPRAVTIGKVSAGILLVLGLFGSVSWLIWFFVATRLVGLDHPPVERPGEPLSNGRKLICAACGLVLILCMMPIPIDLMGGA